MAQFWIPGDSDFAKAARGWPITPRVKYEGPVRLNRSNGITRGLVAATVLERLEWKDLVKQNTYTAGIVGSPVYSVAAGGSGVYYSSGNYQNVIVDAVFNTGGSTVLIVRTPTDSINRNSSAWGTGISGFARFQSHMPDASGTVYFDYGGYSGNNRISYSGEVKNPSKTDVFAFAAGTAGSSIWKDGVKKAGHSNSITYTPQGTVFRVGAGASIGDNQVVHAFFVWTRQLTDAELQSITLDPYQLIADISDTPYLISVPATGGTPTLSSPGVINVLSDRATPQVTLTF